MTYISSSKVFAHLDRLAGWQRGEKPAPVTVEWDLSNRCVLGCQDCHFAHTHIKGPWASKLRVLPMAYESTGDLADIDLVQRVLPEMAKVGVKGIVWSGGGEPTTHPDLHHAAMAAYGVGLEQGMYTLGGTLNRGTAFLLSSLMTWIVVSLDCVDAETYAKEKGVPPERFDAACHAIRYLAEAKGAVIGVSFLLHGENYTGAWDMLALARELGATYTTFRPAIRVMPNRPNECIDDRKWIHQAPLMLEYLAREPDVEVDPARFAAYANWDGHGYTECHGPRLNTTITPDGRVWICPQRRGVTPIGDLRFQSFADIWSKHPGHYTVDEGCRVMCRLHGVNEQLAAIAAPRQHEAFL